MICRYGTPLDAVVRGACSHAAPILLRIPAILHNFIQFGGHASRTPCAAMNFGFGQGSRRPVLNVKA
jgi:hypothetical protein